MFINIPYQYTISTIFYCSLRQTTLSQENHARAAPYACKNAQTTHHKEIFVPYLKQQQQQQQQQQINYTVYCLAAELTRGERKADYPSVRDAPIQPGCAPSGSNLHAALLNGSSEIR